MTRYSSGSVERWGVRVNNAAGKLGVNEDGKGSVQNTTYAAFNDGAVYAVLLQREGTNETVYVNSGLHDVFTGMSSTDPDGDAKIGQLAGTGQKWAGQLGLIACGSGVLDAGQRAILWSYLGY
jgi:hypothetical protein